MFKQWIHRLERHLSQRDRNRQAQPFAWGLEHLIEDNTAQAILNFTPVPNGHRLKYAGDSALNIEARSFMHRYAEYVISQSEQFFAAPPTGDYELRGQYLTFPSAVTSRAPVNNTVHARFFPAPSRGRAVIVLPQWNADSQSHVGLCQLLNRFGLTALRLSLPYHDERKPAELKRAEPLVGPNIGLTLQANRQAVLDVRRAADWLIQQGYQRIGVMGTSIGSCIAFLTLAHDPRISVGVFNHASSYFADVVWTGISTRHVKQGLAPHVELGELRKFWAVLSPQTFVARLRGRDLKKLIISGRYDLSFPPALTKQVLAEFEQQQVPVNWVNLPCGHYTIGHFPFKYLDGFLIVNHFRKHL